MSILRCMRRILGLMVPGAAALVAVFIGADLLADGRAVPVWLVSLPPILIAAGMVLAVLFRQTRMVLVGLMLAAVALSCRPDAGSADFAPLRAALLLPAWFAACACLREKRLLNATGFVLALLAAGVASLLFLPGYPDVDDRLRALANMAVGERWAVVSSLPWPSVLLVAGAMGVLLAGRRRATGALLCQSLLLAMLALDAGGPLIDHPAPLFFFCGISAAGALLLCAVLTGMWQHAFLDELTGLPGRRALRQHMATLGRRQAIAVVDVDHFKKINDRHGHDVGDQVLRFLTSRLAAFRFGKAYRFGGEEFVMVLKRADAGTHFERLDALRADIESKRFVIRSLQRPERKPRGKQKQKVPRGNKTIGLTVSIGMAMRSEKCRTPDEILQAADKALYRAKRGGRNRVKK